MEYILNILLPEFFHTPFYVNVFNMYSESHEFTFLHFFKIYGLLKSWISYLLYSIFSSHMFIHDHHGSLNPKLVLSLSIHFPILMNIVLLVVLPTKFLNVFYLIDYDV